MPLEFYFQYKLADPIFALLIAAPIILISAVVAYLTIRRTNASAAKWRNRFTLAAEILVIAGVVGIFAFVGRTRNENISVELVKTVKDAEYAQAVDFHQLKRQVCVDQHLAPPEVSAANTRSCEKFNDAEHRFSLDSFLPFLARDLQLISEIPNLSAEKVKLFTKAKESTWVLVDARNKKALHEHRLGEASSSRSWNFIFGIAFLVCIGVGFKCGRAAADLANESWPRKKQE